MDTVVLTDSSNYSEDFETSSEEIREYSEQDVYPRLFDYLETSFTSNNYINYNAEETKIELAVGLFLAKASTSKQDILDKVSREYILKKQYIFKPVKSERTFTLFLKILKCFLFETRSENEFMNIKNKRNLRNILEDIRNKVMASVGVFEKDKIQAQGMLEAEANSICKKSELLQEQFY